MVKRKSKVHCMDVKVLYKNLKYHLNVQGYFHYFITETLGKEEQLSS